MSMQMGKLGSESDQRHQYHHHLHSKTKKPMKTMKKSVKITYISSPLMFRVCHASEFRAIVQELTGNNSNKLVQGPDRSTSTTMTHQHVDEGPSPSYSYNIRDSLAFDEGYFWTPIFQTMSGLQSTHLVHLDHQYHT